MTLISLEALQLHFSQQLTTEQLHFTHEVDQWEKTPAITLPYQAQEAVLEQSVAFLVTKGAILIPLTLSTSHIKLP